VEQASKVYFTMDKLFKQVNSLNLNLPIKMLVDYLRTHLNILEVYYLCLDY